MAEETGKNVIASGGVSSLADLKAIEAKGISGAIVGKALYENRFTLKEALEEVSPYMLTKRIIPCLDVKDGRVVKGIQFVQLRDAGDPVELAKFYDEQGADELVFLDISASNEGRKTMVEVVKAVASQLAIPFTVGGGINSLEDMKRMFRAGADKVSLNTAAVRIQSLITGGSQLFWLAVHCRCD